VLRAVVTSLVALTVVAAHADVRWQHERLSAQFEARPVADAIQDVATAVGAELRGGVATPRDVTVTLDAVPLEEALHRLLDGQNFTVRYGVDGGVKAIVLQSGQQAPARPPAKPPAAGAVTDTTPHFPIVLSKMFDRHRPLPLSDPLAERVGEPKATMPELLEMATSDDDGITRSLASQAVLSALERESRYRRSFMRSLHRLSPDDLGSIVDGPSGERFEELLEFLAAHSREPTLQKKAGVVLDQFKGARGAAS
jgi:hypothetical protein